MSITTIQQAAEQILELSYSLPKSKGPTKIYTKQAKEIKHIKRLFIVIMQESQRLKSSFKQTILQQAQKPNNKIYQNKNNKQQISTKWKMQ